MNITLSIDDDVVRKVQKIAIDKNTTLTAMVREYLTSVADADTVERDAAARKEAADKLRESWEQLSRPMSPRNWTRDDLYDRPYAYTKRD
jgi:predicted transcriptional regulator